VDLVVVGGVSMLPTAAPGTIGLVARCAYGVVLPGGYLVRWSDPEPGDVVLLASTEGANAVKRVFETGPAYLGASAGVLSGRGGVVQLYGAALSRLAGSVYVPAGSVFVVGDNRAESFDSRDYGPVPIEKVRGKVLFFWRNPSRSGRGGADMEDAGVGGHG